MEALDYVGILCIEFFIARDGRVLVNELAPRPHNSGHLTLTRAARASSSSNCAICGLPLGSPELLQPAAMVNLLGDVWERGEPNWSGAATARRETSPVRKIDAASGSQNGASYSSRTDRGGGRGPRRSGPRIASQLRHGARAQP